MTGNLEKSSQIYNPELANLETPAWEAALQLAESIDETEQLPISVKHAVEHVQAYLGNLPQELVNVGLDIPTDFTQNLILISHAISTYLYDCVSNNRPWAAQFLFPHNFAISEVKVNLNGQETSALDAFGRLHMSRNIDFAKRIYDQIFLELGEDGSIHFVEGPMYASKTGLSKVLYNMLSLEEQNGVRTRVFIFEGMNEGKLHARAVRGQDINATKVNISTLRAELIEFLEELDKNHQRGIIFIEEATFFTFQPDEVAEFLELIMEAKKAGLHIILTGLNRDFKGRELPVATALNGLTKEAHFYDCRSYVILCGRDGVFVDQSHTEGDTGEFTSRVNVEMGDPNNGLYGFYDFLLPTLVPRVGSAQIVKYLPVPKNYHPMEVIRWINPNLYTGIIDREQPQVFEYYKKMYSSES